MSKKVGLVLQGGGTRSAFTCGFIETILKEKIYFPYIIGTSAGSLIGCNYLAQDQGRSKKVVIDLMHDPRFVSLHNYFSLGSLFDFNFLFYEVPKKILPFSFDRFNNNPATFFCAATDVETGRPVYFKKGECSDILQAVAASSSLPLLTRKPLLVDGHLCLDGGSVANVPFQKALDDGCDKIVVVTTRDKTFRKPPMKASRIREAKFLYKKYPSFVSVYSIEDQIYNHSIDKLDELEAKGKALVIRPTKPVTIGRTEKDKKKLTALFNEGVEVTKNSLEALRLFLSADK